MLKFPKAEDFSLKFEEPTVTVEKHDNKKTTAKVKFKAPDNALFCIENTVPEYGVTLVDGKMPTTEQEAQERLEKADDGSRKTRRAVLLAHTKINPRKVKVADWVLHDGSQLPFGLSKTLLIYRQTAELMAGHDLVYRCSRHPAIEEEVCVREVYLCPVNTISTLVGEQAPLCTACGGKSSYLCKCGGASYCRPACQLAAEQTGKHSESHCLKAMAMRLVRTAEENKEKAVERGKKRAEVEAKVASAREELSKTKGECEAATDTSS